MTVFPISWKRACAFVAELHRHHPPARGQKWAIGCRNEAGFMVGVAQCGRPIARAYDDGLTIEVNRTCTDGAANANSCLYGACWRVARGMGYITSITYTEEGESGISLRAAGYRLVKALKARPSWAGSSVRLKQLRNPNARGDVPRQLWAISTKPWKEVLARFGVTA